MAKKRVAKIAAPIMTAAATIIGLIADQWSAVPTLLVGGVSTVAALVIMVKDINGATDEDKKPELKAASAAAPVAPPPTPPAAAFTIVNSSGATIRNNSDNGERFLYADNSRDLLAEDNELNRRDQGKG